MSGSHLSKDFFELVKAIGESKSKQEEDRIVLNEVNMLKRKMPEATVGRKKMKEFLVRMIYVEMLGHDASFGYIKAVELTASQNLTQKRTGYLTAALALSPTHEFRFMLVNQMQRDLSSSNMLEASAALTALCKLATEDMIPAVMTEVTRLLNHDKELVRKKAVMVLHRMHQLDPESVSSMGGHLRRMLCDKDPSVMGAALCLLHDLAKMDASSYKDLVPSFVSILKQITEHRLPRDFDYHRMPAPWIQMRLLRILALLGRADRTTSEGMYEVLMDVMRRADTGINVGYAVVYECVRTVTTIYPNAPLLDAAAASISRFISAENHNLKYVGVTGLAAIVRDHPKYAQEHQMAVIDCLEDPDETLKRKTLDLLYTMTNPVNVEFIAEKLLSFLEQGTDSFWRKDLVKRITQCAERFAPSNSWYVRIMTRVFRLAGEMVKPEVVHNLMQLIAEGSGEDEEADLQLRRDAVDNYMGLLDIPAVPDQLMQVMAWVLGEYGSLVSPPASLRGVSGKLCDVASGSSFRDPHTLGFVVTALMKLSAQSGEVLPPVAHLLTMYSQSKQSDLQQRCLEFLQLAREGPAAMAAVLPVDASCEDVEVDENLSHLDGVVAAALAAGAVGYSPPAEADGDSDDDEACAAGGVPGSSLNLTPYARPTQPVAPSLTSTPSAQAPLPPPPSSGGAGTPPSTADMFASGPRLRPVSKVWGRPKPEEQAPVVGTPTAPPPSAGSSLSNAPGAAAPGAPGSGYFGSSRAGYGGGSGGGGVAPAQAEDPHVAAMRAEKERMAAMLFGGVSAGGGGAPGGGGGIGAGDPSGMRPPAMASTKVTPSAQRPTPAPAAPPAPALAVEARAPAPAAAETAANLLDFDSIGPSASNGTSGARGKGRDQGMAPAGLVSATEHQHPSSPVDHYGLDLLGGASRGAAGIGSRSVNGSPPPQPASLGMASSASGSDFSGGTLHSRSGSNGVGTAGDELLNGALGKSNPVMLPAAKQPMAGRSGRSGDGILDLSGLLLGSAAGVAGGLEPVDGSSRAPFAYGGRNVRALAISTQEFGRKWKACTGERRAGGNKFVPGLGSPQAVADRLRDRLGVHTVEIIPQTAEGICAGQLQGGGAVEGNVCLVHCKVWAARGTVDLTVRASDPKLAESALAFARTALTQ